MKKVIKGHHRSLRLAKRHAKDAGLVIISRRRADGRLSSRGHTFVFGEKMMWRYTVAAIVPMRAAKREKGNTPSMTARVTTWSQSKNNLKITEARDALMAAVATELGRKKVNQWKDRWFTVNEAKEKVESDPTLEGEIDIGT